MGTQQQQQQTFSPGNALAIRWKLIIWWVRPFCALHDYLALWGGCCCCCGNCQRSTNNTIPYSSHGHTVRNKAKPLFPQRQRTNTAHTTHRWQNAVAMHHKSRWVLSQLWICGGPLNAARIVFPNVICMTIVFHVLCNMYAAYYIICCERRERRVQYDNKCTAINPSILPYLTHNFPRILLNYSFFLRNGATPYIYVLYNVNP